MLPIHAHLGVLGLPGFVGCSSQGSLRLLVTVCSATTGISVSGLRGAIAVSDAVALIMLGTIASLLREAQFAIVAEARTFARNPATNL